MIPSPLSETYWLINKSSKVDGFRSIESSILSLSLSLSKQSGIPSLSKSGLKDFSSLGSDPQAISSSSDCPSLSSSKSHISPNKSSS